MRLQKTVKGSLLRQLRILDFVRNDTDFPYWTKVQ
jgi:hypothetical protein